jgi:Endonuclease I
MLYEGDGEDPNCGDLDLELVSETTASKSSLFGNLATLLKWHKSDPLDNWESNRNEKIFKIQKNRNPFIDHPEYVCRLWVCE